MSTPGVRPFTPDDVPAVADLKRRVFQWREQDSVHAREAAIRLVFVEAPWNDPALPSLVHTDASGAVIGFIGVARRGVWYGDAPLTAAVCTHLMVEPAHRGFAGLALMRRFLEGPQVVSFSDTANEPARRLWARLGGLVPSLYSLQWLRPLRPLRYALGRLRGTRALTLLRAVGRPFAALADAAAARMRGHPFALPPDLTTSAPLAGPDLEAGIRGVLARHWRAVPQIAADSFDWIVTEVRRGPRARALRCEQVTTAAHGPIGWVVWLVEPGGLSEVLHLGGAPERLDAIVAHVCREAWRAGSVAIGGRANPPLLAVLDRCGAHLVRHGPLTLFHARDANLAAALLAGDFYLNRLDGEWAIVHLSDR